MYCNQNEHAEEKRLAAVHEFKLNQVLWQKHFGEKSWGEGKVAGGTGDPAGGTG